MKIKIFEQYVYISKKQLVWSVVVILCIVFLFYSIFSADNLFDETENSGVVIEKQSPCPATETDDFKDEEVTVYIHGMVEVPGLYNVPKGSTIASIVDLAGGLRKEAYTKMNYAYIISENCMINIPRKGKTYRESDIVIKGIVAKDKEKEKAKKARKNDKININTASVNELQEIPWVGESTAQSIIEYRKNTPFKTIEDIKNVSGIGEGKFSKMKDKICV